MLTTSVREYRASPISVAIQRTVSKHDLACLSSAELVEHYDAVLGAMVLSLRAFVFGMEKERIQVHHQWPATWWDAVKERWWPRWAKGMWPVRFERIEIDRPIYAAVCPHIQALPQREHLRWVAQEFDRQGGRP